ncbi:ABC transporter permease [Ensifer aridi]|uniref:ABC transporter permease n=1 Tax=Ensifer aridi TaxID=1708715 RepID=UPI0009C06CB7|nr:ABC transporter permease [Ensifer aridi]
MTTPMLMLTRPASVLPKTALALVGGLVLLFLILPIIVIIPLSFNSAPYFTYPMPGFSLRWYAEIFGGSSTSTMWQRGILNSFIVGISSTVLATVLGTLAALGLSQSTWRYRNVVFAVLVSPLVVPAIVSGLGLFYVFAKLKLVGTFWSLILAHAALGAPFVVITVSATLKGFNQTLLRAAAVHGASPSRAFYEVTLPLISPGVISGAIFAFVWSWDEIVVTLFLATPPQHTVPIRMWSGVRESFNPTITAVATLLIVMAIILMAIVGHLNRRSARFKNPSP